MHDGAVPSVIHSCTGITLQRSLYLPTCVTQ